MESSAIIRIFLLEGHRSTFFGQKHKSAICDRTPPTYTSNLVYMCAGGFRGPKSSNRIEAMFNSYCIFSNCKWPPPWRHPCLSCLTCMCMCVYACMHAHVCLHGALHIPTPTHTPIHPSHLPPREVIPPNQLKCYNTSMNQDVSILLEDLKYV